MKHAIQQVFGGPDETLCGLPAEGVDGVFGCWNEGVFGEVVECGKDGAPDVMKPTTGFDCPGCVAAVAAGGRPALVHFPSDRVGLTWCGLPFASPGGNALKGVDRNGLAYSTDMADVTCPGCDTDEPVYPGLPAEDPPEVTLARLVLEVDSRALPPAKWKALRDAAEAVLAKAGRA